MIENKFIRDFKERIKYRKLCHCINIQVASAITSTMDNDLYMSNNLSNTILI